MALKHDEEKAEVTAHYEVKLKEMQDELKHVRDSELVRLNYMSALVMEVVISEMSPRLGVEVHTELAHNIACSVLLWDCVG